MEKKILNIPLETISDLVPKNLINIFRSLGLKTIKEVVEYPVGEFSEFNEVERRTIRDYVDFKVKLLEEPDLYFNHWLKKSNCLELLKLREVSETESYLDLFYEVIQEYFKTEKNKFHRDLLLATYGINTANNPLDAMAAQNKKTLENCVKIKEKIVKTLNDLLTGDKVDFPAMILNPAIVQTTRSVIIKLSEEQLYTFNELKLIFSDYFNETFDERKEKLMLMFLDIIGMKEFEPSSTYFTKARLFISKNINQTEIIFITSLVLEILKKVSVPIREDEFISWLKNTHLNVDTHLLDRILNLLPEIEKTHIGNQTYYQIIEPK